MIRVLFTAVVIGIYLFAIGVFSPVATLASGQTPADQFQNSDGAYLRSVYTMNALSGFGFIMLAGAVAAIAAIWWGPARKFAAQIAAGSLALLLWTQPAPAFFEKTDRAEAYTIMPNESAFWIPDVGANKDAQAQLDSENYLNANKLAVKRFIIPHQKFSGSGGWASFDYFVPTGRLIIVDRTPYSREWVDAEDRGTAKLKEGFPCQSKEGLNITVGISIGASVMERDAAKFLYRFGVVAPKGDRTSGEVIFTSVYYGRSLRDVMDDVGRKKVQTMVCGEISNRTFDKANDEANKIIAEVEVKTRTFFETVGITLDFIGWGDTFEFDKDVQKAVNDAYAAQKLAAAMPILQALAQIKVQEGLGRGLGDKGPPIVVTPGMIETLVNLVRPPAGP